MSDTPKESAYNAHIFPLMVRVIELCKEHRINMAATFALDANEDGEQLYCTTILPADKADEHGGDMIQRIRRVVHPTWSNPAARPAGVEVVK